jgi:predicted ATPase
MSLVAGRPEWQGACVIASVHFRNFKALRNTQLKLLPFNLVIGPNGSGKTSLIQAVQQLCTLARLPLGTEPVTTRAGAAEISFHFAPPHESVRARLGCVADNVCDLLRVDAPAGGWESVRAALLKVRSYVFDQEALAAPALQNDGHELAPDGGNLTAVLARRRVEQPEAFARLTKEFLRIMPEFTALQFTQPDSTHTELELVLADASEGAAVAAENVSQGTLALLGILTIALDPTPPTTVCIEEIDRGIHPRMLREVRDALYRLSYPAAFGETRPPVQVIATTHSPYLLDLFRDHPEEIVISQKVGVRAHFERLAERPDLPDLLREGSLGDIWFSGILGGVPAES